MLYRKYAQPEPVKELVAEPVALKEPEVPPVGENPPVAIELPKQNDIVEPVEGSVNMKVNGFIVLSDGGRLSIQPATGEDTASSAGSVITILKSPGGQELTVAVVARAALGDETEKPIEGGQEEKGDA